MSDKNERSSVEAQVPAPPEFSVRSHLIDNVSVRLEAYLGGSRMTIAELAALREGALLPLDAPLTQAVELRLNGVAVAKGELVSVGDKFGVRLSEVSK